jgi:RimJ/RimL family protein N-acetyltransferase
MRRPELSLRGENVVLRDFTNADLDDIFAIVSDDRVTRWLSFDSKSQAQAQQMLDGILERAQDEPRTEYYIAVTRHDDDRVVGFVRLAKSGVRAGKLGYSIHADYQGHGYATDAARTIINFGFDVLNLHRITAAIGPDNAASIAVVKRLGFTHEGRLRDHVFTNGAWRDSLLYSNLKDEPAGR